MGLVDDATWAALTVILTLSGLAASGVLWRRRGPASGMRMLAIALLPVAAFLTGTFRLFWEIGDAVVSWAVRFAFSPFVWLGIVVAGVAAVLFTVASGMRKRGIGTKQRDASPGLPASPNRSAAKPRGKRAPEPAAEPAADEGLDDIAEILKKHGIS